MTLPRIAIATVAAFLVAFLITRVYIRSRRRDAAWFVGKPVAEGTITRCDEASEGYSTTIEYLGGGQQCRLRGDFGYWPPDVGKRVAIAYDPHLPTEARIVDDEPIDAGTALGPFFTIFTIVLAMIVGVLAAMD